MASRINQQNVLLSFKKCAKHEASNSKGLEIICKNGHQVVGWCAWVTHGVARMDGLGGPARQAP